MPPEGPSSHSPRSPMPPSSIDVLLVGGGVAAARCARTLRRERFDGTILLVGDEAVLPYNRPPLSKELLRDDLPDALVAAEPEGWWDRHGVGLHLGDPVVELDAGRRRVRTAAGAEIAFDRGLLATGAAPRRPPLPGGERALLLRTLADARRLRAAALDAGAGAPAVVIGGGFIGVEVASSLAAIGLRPTIVELGDRLWGGSLGMTLAERALALLDVAGVEVRLGAAASRIGDGAVTAAGEEIPAAIVVAGIGVRPRDELAAAAGLDVGDGILVDDAQATSAAAIWAAGDVARSATGRFEHWHGARDSGERAARAMLGMPIGPPAPAWLYGEVAGRPFDVVGVVASGMREVPVVDGVVAFLGPDGSGAPVTAIAVEEARIPVAAARSLVASQARMEAVRDVVAASAAPGATSASAANPVG